MKVFFPDEEKEIMDRPLKSYYSVISKRISKIKAISRPAAFYFRSHFICETDFEKAAEHHFRSGAEFTEVYIEGFYESPFYIGIPCGEKAEKTSSLTLKGFVCKTEDAKSISEFCRRILEGKSIFTVAGRRKSGVIMGKDTRLTVGAKIIPPVYLGNGAIIEENTEIEAGSVIGSGCVISRGSRITGGIIGSGTYIGQNVKVCRNAVIESCCYIGNEITVKEGLTVKKGERIDSGMVSGSPHPPTHLRATETGFSYCCIKGRGRIAVGFSGSPAGEMQKNGILAGIMSAGGEAIDMGSLPLFAFRNEMTSYGASGGIYINEEASGPLFFGRKGLMEATTELSSGCWAQVNPYYIKPSVPAQNAGEIYSLKIAAKLEKRPESGFIFFSGGSPRIKAHLNCLGEKCRIVPVEIKEKTIRPGGWRINFRADGEISEIYNPAGEIIREEDFYFSLYGIDLNQDKEKTLLPVKERKEELIKKLTLENAEEERLILTDGCYAIMKIAQ